MKIKYHKQIVNMLYEEWDLGKEASLAKGKTCAWIYWFEILGDLEQLIIEKDKDNIIGICAYSKKKSKKYKIRKNFYKLLKKLLVNSFLIKNKEAIYKYDSDYDYLPKSLENKFDGEISILIVDKKYRGKQIGKSLLEKTFKKAKEDDVCNIYILSSESCNYKFYELLGCKKIYEKLILNGEPNKCGNKMEEMGFIYKKRLKK